MKDLLYKIKDFSYFPLIATSVFLLFIIALSTSIFISYLYNPLFNELNTPAFNKPVLNDPLLQSVLTKINADQEDLTNKFQDNFSDPFE